MPDTQTEMTAAAAADEDEDEDEDEDGDDDVPCRNTWYSSEIQNFVRFAAYKLYLIKTHKEKSKIKCTRLSQMQNVSPIW